MKIGVRKWKCQVFFQWKFRWINWRKHFLLWTEVYRKLESRTKRGWRWNLGTETIKQTNNLELDILAGKLTFQGKVIMVRKCTEKNRAEKSRIWSNLIQGLKEEDLTPWRWLFLKKIFKKMFAWTFSKFYFKAHWNS